MSGYARNLSDGRVEVLAVGAPQQVQLLIDWLWIGSATAHVTDVQVEELDLGSLPERPVGFGTK